jgi:hypothetical protein
VNAATRLLLLIPVGYIAALVAAALVVTFASMGFYGFGDAAPVAVGLTIGFMFFAGMISFIPMGIAIFLAETMNIRSLIVWLAIGGGIGLLNSETTLVFDGLTFVDNLRLVCVAAGFVGGFVYWAIAGRNSGLFRTTSTGSESV